MNQIGTIYFDFRMQSESFARGLYGRWDRFFATCVESVADEALKKLKIENGELKINKLELDLGAICEEELDEQFPIRFREKLEEALMKWITENEQLLKQDAKQKSNSFSIGLRRTMFLHFQFSILKTLCRFLLYGSLDWSAQQQYKSISELFLLVLKAHGAELKQFLHQYGHYTSLQQRLVYQLNQPELEAGVRLLVPSESTFIISYVRLLHQKYREVEKSVLTETDHRVAVWKVVYAYLLTNRSSYFNKKSFVVQTITQLAAEYNTTYHALLEVLTHELARLTKDKALLPELFQVLNELQKELDQRQFEASAQSASKLYKSLSVYLQDQLKTGITEQHHEALIRMLSQPDSCRKFLDLLREEEIIRLVPIVLPNESDFVIDYAHSLDQQKEQGALQGKAGGEFSKLKWQFIFTLLFANRGTMFDRKQFVSGVLKQIAQHYNLELMLLLEYFQTMMFTFTNDKQLQTIITELYQEVYKHQTKTSILLLSETIGSLKEEINKGISNTRRKEILLIVSQANTRKLFIERVSEEEIIRLLPILIPKESRFVIEYAGLLDKQKERGALEGKAGGEFSKLKWQLIFTLLFHPNQTVLNRKYFTLHVLKGIAAHYNLDVLELLQYITREVDKFAVSNQLRALLKELHQERETLPKDTEVRTAAILLQIRKQIQNATISGPDIKEIEHALSDSKQRNAILYQLNHKEQQQWITLVLQLQRKENIIPLLIIFYPSERAFIQSYASWLEQCFRPALLPTIAAKEFFFWVWRLLFNLLSEEVSMIHFSRKEFVKRVLERIAKQYHLRNEALYKMELFGERSSGTSAQLHRLLNQVFHEQINGEPQGRDNKSASNIENDQIKESRNDKPLFTEEELNEPIYINNAGMVLIAPYLPRLFSMLELMKDGTFRDREAQIRAMFVMQYLVFERTEFPEYEMMLNKLLTNFNTGDPIPQQVELTVKEKEAADSLLKAVLQHWEKLKNTSIQGLREGFLQREGKLYHTDKGWQLTVETKSYDMLLDTLPWSFNTVKFSWMKEIIHVNWR